MTSVELTDVTFAYTSRPLLNHISLHVGAGERACLVGPNGCGKTTLLQLITGEITPDNGKIVMHPANDASRSHAFNFKVTRRHTTVEDFFNHSLSDLYALLSRFDEVTAGLACSPNDPMLASEYDSLLTQMSSTDVWSIDARIDETLAGLGLPQLAGAGRSRHLHSLSPGQRVRLELTALLVSRPDVLVLDEPTNHLDKDGSNFLVRMLMDWSGPVILASHDRAFINKVATVIYDLDIASWQALATASGLDTIPGAYRCQGNYSDYLVAKTHAREAHKQLHSSQQVEKRSIQAHRASSQSIAQGGSHMKTATGMARKFYSDRATSTAARRIRNDDRRLDDLKNREVRKLRTYDLRLDFADAPTQTGVAVSARNATLLRRLQEVTFDLMHGEHLLITGPNGAGKSTLVNWIAAGAPPTMAHGDASGTITRDDRLVLIPQRLPQQGDPGFTETVWNEGIGQMGTGIIHPSMWNIPVSALSAGNQRRAQIAVAIAKQPAILLIDEPTNYLDLNTIEAFEDAISEWSGTLIIVSHDQWLIDKWRGKRLCLGSSA